MLRISHTFVLVFLIVAIMRGNILKVPSEFPTIQEAINNSIDGDTVLVDNGIYFENLRFNGKNITVASKYILTGSREDIANTIINGSNPADEDFASCVLFINGETREAVLEGFTLTGGKGTRWEDEHGAGIYYEGGGILAAFASPTIKNNIIEGNSAFKTSEGAVSSGGGAIRCGDAAPLIINNIVRNNKAQYGGGIVLNYTVGAEVVNNLIINNEVKGQKPYSETFGGGGLWVNHCESTIVVNNTICNNKSSGGGSAEAAGKGGGCLIWSGDVIFTNNIVWYNEQSDGGDAYLIRSIPANFSYNNVSGGIIGDNNIDLDPLFESETYILSDDSPSIDSGNPLDEFNDLEDSQNPGNPKYPAKGGIQNDQGVFGGKDLLMIAEISTDVEDYDRSSLPENFKLYQNYPNPFNPVTKIKYTIPTVSRVELSIYNLLGEKIKSLVNEIKPPGIYEEEFSSNGLSSGIYIYSLVAGRFTETKKLTLLK